MVIFDEKSAQSYSYFVSITIAAIIKTTIAIQNFENSSTNSCFLVREMLTLDPSSMIT